MFLEASVRPVPCRNHATHELLDDDRSEFVGATRLSTRLLSTPKQSKSVSPYAGLKSADKTTQRVSSRIILSARYLLAMYGGNGSAMFFVTSCYMCIQLHGISPEASRRCSRCIGPSSSAVLIHDLYKSPGGEVDLYRPGTVSLTRTQGKETSEAGHDSPCLSRLHTFQQKWR